MSWIQFFTWSLVLYGIYYGVTILLDTMKPGKTRNRGSTDNVLHFSEDDEQPKTLGSSDPIKQTSETVSMQTSNLDDEHTVVDVSEKVNSAVEGMGVSLKGLFDLARTEAIEFTKPISFQ